MSSWERLEDQDNLVSDFSDSSPLASGIKSYCCGKWRSVNILLGTAAAILFITALCLTLRTSTSTSTSTNKNGKQQQLLSKASESTATSKPFIDPFPEELNSTGLTWKSFDPPEFSPFFSLLEEAMSVFDSSNSTGVESNSLTQPVTVTIYYETLSQDSRGWLVHQFFPTFTKLRAYIRPRLVPYGNANVSGDEGMSCEHGHDECQGNLVHACALRQTAWNESASVGRTMAYIGCMVSDIEMLDPRADEIGLKCSRFVKLNWDPIFQCTRNGEGLAELGKYGELTRRLPLGRPMELPVVVLADFEQADKDQVRSNFFKYMCTSVLENEPPACTTTMP
jgi:interferon gamma-inducible protein 30